MGPLSGEVLDVLLDPSTVRRNILNPQVVERKLEAHRRGEGDYAVQIFNWLTLEL